MVNVSSLLSAQTRVVRETVQNPTSIVSSFHRFTRSILDDWDIDFFSLRCNCHLIIFTLEAFPMFSLVHLFALAAVDALHIRREIGTKSDFRPIVRRLSVLIIAVVIVIVYLIMIGMGSLLSENAKFPTDEVPSQFSPFQAVPKMIHTSWYILFCFVHKQPPERDRQYHVKLFSLFEVDPLTLCAASISSVFCMLLLGFSVLGSAAFETVLCLTMTFPLGLFAIYVYAAHLGSGRLTRREEDLRVLISAFKSENKIEQNASSRSRVWWHRFKLPVRVVFSGTFLVSLSFSAGSSEPGYGHGHVFGGDSYGQLWDFLSLPVQLSSLVDATSRQARMHKVYSVMAVLLIYGGCLVGVFMIRLMHGPRSVFRAVTICCRLLYNFFLISTTRFLILGIRCTSFEVQPSDDLQVLAMDPNFAMRLRFLSPRTDFDWLHCFFGFLHRTSNVLPNPISKRDDTSQHSVAASIKTDPSHCFLFVGAHRASCQIPSPESWCSVVFLFCSLHSACILSACDRLRHACKWSSLSDLRSFNIWLLGFIAEKGVC